MKQRLVDYPLGCALFFWAFVVLSGMTLVLYLTGAPWHHGWGWQAEPLPWANRITYAALVVTAGGAVVALVVSYRRQRDAERGRFTAEFAQAAAQLGGDTAAVRIAGAYAMAALADTHVDRQQQCINVLCGYLRMPYSPRPAHDRAVKETIETTNSEDQVKTTVELTHSPGEREVRLTIMRVIRDHLGASSYPNWRGRYFDFTGATLDGGDFSSVVWSGAWVSFLRANFPTGEVFFDKANFCGARVVFDYATFSGGEVSFQGAKFSGGAPVSFSHVDISGGAISFKDAEVLTGVSFLGARFAGGLVSFDHVDFARRKAAGRRVAAFDNSEFSGGVLSFKAANFQAGVVSFKAAKFAGGSVVFDPDANFLGDALVDFDESEQKCEEAFPAGPWPGQVRSWPIRLLGG